MTDTNAIRNLQDELASALDKMAHYDLVGSSKLERCWTRRATEKAAELVKALNEKSDALNADHNAVKATWTA